MQADLATTVGLHQPSRRVTPRVQGVEAADLVGDNLVWEYTKGFVLVKEGCLTKDTILLVKGTVIAKGSVKGIAIADGSRHPPCGTVDNESTTQSLLFDTHAADDCKMISE